MNFRIGRDSEEEQLELGRISNQEGWMTSTGGGPALGELAAAVVVNAMHQCECIACRF